MRFCRSKIVIATWSFLAMLPAAFPAGFSSTAFPGMDRDRNRGRYWEDAEDRWIIELSPFKNLWGQASLRLEKTLLGNLSTGLLLEKYSKHGERQGYPDSHSAATTEALWSYELTPDIALFGGLGLGWEQAQVGRQAPSLSSPYTPHQGKKNDEERWAEKHHQIHSQQSLGLRVYSQNFWTASLRMVADEVLWHSLTASDREIDPYRQQDRAEAKKNGVSLQYMLFAGIYLP